MVTSFCKRSWGGMISVPAVPVDASRVVVLKKAAFDGVNRDHFF
jgi:hypothetical protein